MFHYGFGWGFYPFFPFISWIFWVFIIILFWHGMRNWHGHSYHEKEKSAEEILADRFARGEIDEDEYKKRLDVLKKHAK